MKTEAIQTRLLGMREMDFGGAEKLARDIVRDARRPLLAFHRALAWPHNPDWNKAEFVLKRLEELSILPWLAVARQVSGKQRIQALFEACEVYQRLEQRVVQQLRRMLEDRTLLPPPPFPGAVETRVLVPRECDKAYLLLRRLCRPDEPEGEYRVNESEFLRMKEQKRDGWIQRYQQTGEWELFNPPASEGETR
ncbi:MAG: hypothetical protein AB1898_15030 [Acidobacteriota bacterium]